MFWRDGLTEGWRARCVAAARAVRDARMIDDERWAEAQRQNPTAALAIAIDLVMLCRGGADASSTNLAMTALWVAANVTQDAAAIAAYGRLRSHIRACEAQAGSLRLRDPNDARARL